MCVRIEVVLAVFIIAVALGAETELQRRIVLLRPAADGASVLGHALGCSCLAAEIMPLLCLPGSDVDM